MNLTFFAEWLNTAFAGFDEAVLSCFHTLALHASPVLTPIMEFFSLIGDNGYFCFFLAALLFCFAKTRKASICLLFAIAIGAILTNLLLKELIARPRPYEMGYGTWWLSVGAHVEADRSFPSGHVTAATACMTAVCLSLPRKWQIITPASLYVLCMAAARCYLMVHYPTDVIGGMIVGGIAACLAFVLIQLLWKRLERNREQAVCRWLLEADIRHALRKGDS